MFSLNCVCFKQVERQLRLDDNILRYFTLQPRTQADLIRTKKGWKSGTWLEYDPSMQEKKEEMLARLFGDDLKQPKDQLK